MGQTCLLRSSFKLALAEVLSVQAEGPILYQSRAERHLSPLGQTFMIATLQAAALPVGSSGMVIKPNNNLLRTSSMP